MFGLGTGDDAPEERRAFLQKRIREFFGVILVIFFTIYFASIVFAQAFGRGLGTELSNPLRVIQSVVLLQTLGLWWIVRGGPRSVRALGRIDALGTVSLCLSYAAVRAVTGNLPTYAMILFLGYTLTVRAALIPTRPGHTVLIGLLGGLPLVPAAYLARSGALGVTV